MVRLAGGVNFTDPSDQNAPPSADYVACSEEFETVARQFTPSPRMADAWGLASHRIFQINRSRMFRPCKRCATYPANLCLFLAGVESSDAGKDLGEAVH